MSAPRTTAQPVALLPLARVALQYGVAGFGGGYSVLAQLRRELVEKRRWLDEHEFLELAELSKSLPGTAATALLALLGHRVAGTRGGFLAAGAFLLPSAVLVSACAAAYPLLARVRDLGTFFDGMNAAMVGVVGAVTLELGRVAIRSRLALLGAVACAALLIFRVLSEPLVALAAGLLGAAYGTHRARAGRPDDGPGPSLHGFAAGAGKVLLGAAGVGTLATLVQVFVPIGVLTFGGGLAMIPAIEHAVVSQHHWLTPKEFADAIAIGQITPGPVAICATFIGYRAAGVLGALVATVAMFGPAVAVAIAAGHSVQRFRESAAVRGALHALGPAVIGMLAAATESLGRTGITHAVGAVAAVGAFVAVVKTRVSPIWVLAGGGVLEVGWRLYAGRAGA